MQINLSRPEHLAIAPYADMAVVAHSPHGFSIDFVAVDSGSDTELNGTVVARVKVPPSVVFQIASAIAENVDQYEKKFGKITPGQPDGT